MKWNKIILTLALILTTLNIAAQRPGRERIKTLKVAYITEQLSLDSKEAQQFWPVYNAHEEKMETLRRQRRSKFGERLADLSALSDAEAEDMLSKYVDLQMEKQRLESEYLKDLRGVISAKKIILLFKAEENFKKRLLQQVRRRRNGQ